MITYHHNRYTDLGGDFVKTVMKVGSVFKLITYHHNRYTDLGGDFVDLKGHEGW
jgi:hypothetical protein